MFTMGKISIWLWLACWAAPAFAVDRPAASRVTVEQLEQQISTAKDKRDSEEAKQLLGLELTERLSTARYQQLKALLPGEKSEQALMALADVSAFLEPPPGDIPATAAPDTSTQRSMLALTVAYLGKALPLLPNLLATRETTRFEGRPSSFDANGENPLREVDRSAVTVFYRDGKEYFDAVATKGGKRQLPDKGLTTRGEFGTSLGMVVMDAARSHLAWSHWELGSSGPLAVFQYAVPKEKSHYDVHFCCVTQSYGFEVNYLSQRAGYHGEITIDPETGTILRLTMIADLDSGNPISQASMLVEYGPEELGGTSYICPERGIALALGPDLKTMDNAMAQRGEAGLEHLQAAAETTSLAALAHEPKQILLNDVVFRQYHLFRADARLLTEKEAQSALRTAAAAPPSTPEVPSPENGAQEEESSAGANASAAEPAAEAAAEAAATNVPAPSPAGPRAASIPEIDVTELTGLPQEPIIPQPANSAANPTYRVNVRLVDVPLVATDKKGHPLANINANDLEVYDNGTKVDIRYLVAANATAPVEPDTAAQPTAAPSEREFTNMSGTGSKRATAAVQNTMILLLDSVLSFDDLANARDQVEEFLKGLHDKDRVAVYVMRKGGFQILQDTSTDHQQIAAALAKWTPSAENMQMGQEEEARNRQQMDYVNNTEDLLSVNGNQALDTQSHAQALDPSLRELGDDPGGDALGSLLFVARYLAAMPGHKSLVWIASDNVLADWNNSGLNMQKGEHHIEPAALRVQEAMNDAHVSVYPLDASRLEAGGVGADLAEINVQLNPAATANQMGCGQVTGTSRAGGLAGGDPALTSGPDINSCAKNLDPGRMKAQMQQDLHSIQGVYREIADATGGRAFRRASDVVGELNDVADDDRATYLLSFSPATAADNQYHVITIKLPGKKNVVLRYRTGYFYKEEPATLKDRFRDAALGAGDVSDIGVTAKLVAGSQGHTIKLGIAATDLAMAEKDTLWTDKLDIFLVQREISGTKAQITGQCMNLRLQPGSYQKYLKDGIPFDQAVETARGTGSIRIVVLDENSGRLGSVTIPVSALKEP